MKAKNILLENIKAKIKLWQDAYKFNEALPDDVFELSLNGSSGINLPIEENKIPLTKEENHSPKLEDIDAYGAKRRAIKGLISSNPNGVFKKAVISYLETIYKIEKNKAESMATNTITALIKSEEIEAFKRGKYRINKTIKN